jgi:PHD/YefM family antitoxin component YafN of YafNO toxin-antitoxin module
MKTIEITKALKPLSEYANELDKEILVLTSNERPVAALVSLKNVDIESLSLSTNPDFMEIIEKSRKDFKFGKRLSLDEMKEEITKM